MTRRLGAAAFWLAALVALLLLAMAGAMLVNGVPDARGGAAVLGVIAAGVVIVGVGLRFVCGWKAK